MSAAVSASLHPGTPPLSGAMPGRSASAAPAIDLGPVSADSADQVDDLLTKGFPLLRFPALLEARFQAELANDRLRVILISAVLVLVMFNGHLLTDWLMTPDVLGTAVLLRSGIYSPLCLVGLFVLCRPAFSPRAREWVVLAAALLAIAISVYLCTRSRDPLAGPYLSGLAVIVLFSHAVVQMRFWLAVILDVFILAAYAVGMSLAPSMPHEVAISSALVLVATIVFSLYVCYRLESDQRRAWLQRWRESNLLGALETANDRLDRMSRSDLLTQVANRRHFDEFLLQSWARAAVDGNEVAIMMIDVDHFKAYNDHYGHPAGDECLRQVAAALKRRLRRPCDLVARFGGEEFVAVLPNTPLRVALEAAERIRGAVERMRIPHLGSSTSSFVTVSVGVASIRPMEPQAVPQKLVSKADQALYDAKSQGRNRVCPSSDMPGAGRGLA